jgi:hypothetical protein
MIASAISFAGTSMEILPLPTRAVGRAGQAILSLFDIDISNWVFDGVWRIGL